MDPHERLDEWLFRLLTGLMLLATLLVSYLITITVFAS